MRIVLIQRRVRTIVSFAMMSIETGTIEIIDMTAGGGSLPLTVALAIRILGLAASIEVLLNGGLTIAIVKLWL